MTIRQIAETANCGVNTVRRIGKSMFPMVKQVRKGYPIEYTKDQIIAIMDKLPKRNYLSDPTQIGNPTPTQTGNPNAPTDIVQNNHVDYVEIGKMIAMAVTSAMTPILQELRKPQEPQQLQIENVPEKTTRAMFRQEISKLVSLSKSDFSTTYNLIYHEMGYVYGVNIKARANNRKVSCIDVLEVDGLMGKAIAVTRQEIKRLENANN